MKTARKVLLYLLTSIAALLIIASVSVWLFQDRIIQGFIAEANKNLNTPVKIGKIDISMWSDFPDLAIVFTDVYVEDSHPGNYPLFTAKTVSFSLNPLDLWAGNYSVKGLSLKESETNLKIDEDGLSNYVVLKSTPSGERKTVVFDLKNIHLNGTHVTYHNLRLRSRYGFRSEKLTASIALRSDLYHIGANGDLATEEINTGHEVFLQNRIFDVRTELVYDDSKKELAISSAFLKINKSSFEVQGTCSFGNSSIDLRASGKDTDIHTLLSLLPADLASKFSAYKSNGHVYLSVSLKGVITERKSPGISVTFGCSDASVYHPEYKSTIKHATLEGSFASPSLTDLSHAVLILKKISGELNGKRFDANFSLQDFDNPLVSMDFKGEMDAGSLLDFYPVPEIKRLSGAISANVSFAGRILLLKKKSTAQQVHTQGSIEMKNIALTAGAKDIQFSEVGGSLQFNNNDLALSDVSGKFENSDFRLNGFFKNVITYILFDHQPLGIETDLKSDFLDLDQLLAIGFSEKGSNDFNFHISPDLHLNFNCDVKALRYKRFRAQNVRGDLMIRNQMAISRNINLKAMGGSLSLNGILNAKNPKAIDLISGGKLSGIYLDSLFYIFENFDQTFIDDRHLKGQTFADITVGMTLNEKLNLFPETLTADMSVTIRNGELNEFEPMQKLNKYLDDEGLAHLRFADLKNDIHIEKKTIYIPQMEVRTNVTTIQVSGTHTFDQHIDYRVVAPLHSRRKIDRDEAFGAIEEDNTGQSKLFLKIAGTTTKYTISYDKDAVKKKIRNDLKKEVQELKDAFKNKGMKKKKELEVEKDEYFDWDKPE